MFDVAIFVDIAGLRSLCLACARHAACEEQQTNIGWGSAESDTSLGQVTAGQIS